MNKFIKAVVGSSIAFVLLFAMIRSSGRAAIPIVFLFGILLSYVVYSIISGKESPYPRISTGMFERKTESEIKLSQTDSCESCTDDRGDGIRTETITELVFLGVPLANFGTETKVMCRSCSNPLEANEWDDYIERELAKERESE